MPENVAMIGSGLAGLTTAYLLSSKFNVTIFEKQESAGVDIASVITKDGIIIDSPMRGIQKEYYPSLFELVRHLGLELFITNVDANYHVWQGSGETNESFLGTSAFMHRMSILKLPGLIRDWLGCSWFIKRSSIELARLYLTAVALKTSGKIVAVDQTFGKYLDCNYYTSSFKYDFMAPFLCGIATCSVDEVMEYPASIILDLVANYGTDIYQLKGGIKTLVAKLLQPISQTIYGTCITGCWRDSFGKLILQDSRGTKHKFDKVIFSTPSPVITKILSTPPPHGLHLLPHLTTPLSTFTSVPVRVIIHTDPTILPLLKSTWKSLNLAIDSRGETMSTQWINSIQGLNIPQDYFETSSFIVSPSPLINQELVISEHVFVRGVVTRESLEGIDQLERKQGVDGVYVTGSWVYPGMPLLEGCVASALRIADKLGVERVFGKSGGGQDGLVRGFLKGELSGQVTPGILRKVCGMGLLWLLYILTMIIGLLTKLV